MYILLDPVRADPVLHQCIFRGCALFFAVALRCRLFFDGPATNVIAIRDGILKCLYKVRGGEEITIRQHVVRDVKRKFRNLFSDVSQEGEAFPPTNYHNCVF